MFKETYKQKILAFLLGMALLFHASLPSIPRPNTAYALAQAPMQLIEGEEIDEEDKVIEEEPETTNEVPEVTEEEIVEDGFINSRPIISNISVFMVDSKNIKDILEDLGLNPSILTNYEIGFKDKEGNLVTNPTVEDYFEATFNFKIPEDLLEVMTGGEYYEIELPEQLKLVSNQKIDLIDGTTGITYGQVTESNGKIIITFNEYVQEISNVEGGFTFRGQLDKDSIEEPGDIEIKIPFEDDLDTTVVTVKPNTESSIDKDGWFDRSNNPSAITWQVDANKALDELNDLTIHESFPDTVTFVEAKVYKVKVDLEGNVIENSEELLVSGFTIDSEGNITFDEPVNYAIRILYETTIDNDKKPSSNGGTMSFFNKVSMEAEEMTDDLDASATLTGSYNARLNKAATAYDKDNQIITWQVQYNYDESIISKDTQLLDQLSKGLELDEDSFVIKKVSFDAKGNAVIGEELLKGSDYEVVYDEQENKFIIKFLDDFDYAINIQYKTIVTDILDENTLYNNKIEDEYGHSSNGNGNATQQGVIKTVASVNVSSGIIYWKIEINKNHYTMYNWKLTDTLPTGTTYLNDLKVVDGSGKTLTIAESSASNTGDYYANINDTTMELELLNDYNPTSQNFIITYSTSYTHNTIPSNGKFTNTASSSWEEENGTKHGSKDTATYTPSKEQLYNGSKGGSYNATTKEITWIIRINYANTGLKNASIDDTIEADQHFIHDSVRIYYFEIESGEKVVKSTELTAEEYQHFLISEPTDENNLLHIKIPDSAEDKKYWIEYKTSLEGEIIGKEEYNNTAYVNNDLTEKIQLDASASVANGGKYVGKQARVDNAGDIWWNITVNASQSTLENIKITDVPSENQIIDLESIVIYGTNVAENGDIELDDTNLLLIDEDYTVEYFLNDNQQWQLEIKFLDIITTPYIVQYRVTVMTDNSKPQVTLTNNATISGENQETVEGGDKGNITVDVGSGSGWIVGTAGSITFKKVDSISGAILEGVEFELYHVNQNTKVEKLISTVATNVHGELVFSYLTYGNYKLVEKNPIEGYSLMEEYYFKLDASTTGKTISLSNQPSEVHIIKKCSMSDEVLSNTEFALYQYDDNTNQYERILADKSLITDENGLLDIYTLSAGKYYLQEIKASSGYQLDNKQYFFTIEKDMAGKLSTNYEWNQEGIIYNTPTKVSFYKVDQSEEQNPLSGAKFVLEKYNPETNNWDSIDTINPIVSDDNGYIEVTNLTIGEYRLIEVEAPLGFARDQAPILFTIDETNINQDIVLDDFTNYPTQAQLKKVDEYGNGLFGARFTLYWVNPETNEWEQIRTDEIFETDENGLLTIGYIHVATKYKLIEVRSPAGYNLDETPIEFEIEENDDGSFRDVKLIELDDFVNTPSLVTLYKVTEDEQPLTDTHFKLERYNSTTDEWEVMYEDLITNEVGIINVEALPIGKYRFMEVEATDGYLWNSDVYEFEILANDKGQLIPIEIEVINYENGAILTKKDHEENLLMNAEFTLEKLMDDTWTQIREEERFITDENGEIIVTRLLAGEYRFIEKNAPEGYLLDYTPIYFVIEKNMEEYLYTEIAINYPTEVSLSKVDSDSHSLKGAQFILYKQEGVGWTIIDEDLMTDKDGLLLINNLSSGKYRLVETKAPIGYQLDATPIEFTIEEDQSQVVILDDFVNLKIVQSGSTISTNDITQFILFGLMMILSICYLGNIYSRKRK